MATYAADLLVLLDSPGRRIGVPAKLYEYIATRRPILAFAAEDSDTDLVLRGSGRPHRIVPYGKTAKHLKDAILDLAKEALSPMPHETNGGCQLFTREANARTLVGLLSNLRSK